MTHDELLARINELKYEVGDSGMNEEHKASYALRAVVELHKEMKVKRTLSDGDWFETEQCEGCLDFYPCPTIQAIEKELG